MKHAIQRARVPRFECMTHAPHLEYGICEYIAETRVVVGLRTYSRPVARIVFKIYSYCVHLPDRAMLDGRLRCHRLPVGSPTIRAPLRGPRAVMLRECPGSSCHLIPAVIPLRPAQLDFEVGGLKPISEGHSFHYAGAPYQYL
jgi:hypothetical protein